MIVTIHKIIFLIPSPQSKVTQLPTVAVLERRSSLFRRPPGYHHLGSIPKSAHTHIYTQTHTHDTHKHTHTHTHKHTHKHTRTLTYSGGHQDTITSHVDTITSQVDTKKFSPTLYRYTHKSCCKPRHHNMEWRQKNIFKDFVLNSRPHPPQGFHEISI